MFTRSIFAACLLLSAIPLCAEPLNEAQTSELLQKISEANGKEDLQADLNEVREDKMTVKPIIKSGKLWFKRPNKFKEDFPGNNLYVCDGSTLWNYSYLLEQTETYTVGKERRIDNLLAAITAGFDFSRLSSQYKVSAEEDGASWKLTLVPKGALKKQVSQLILWLSKEFIIQKSEASLYRGGRITTTFRNVRRVTVPDSTFDFKPPEGTKVISPLER